jgi:N-acetylated-alpha-linked acidic dipeptidase
VIFTDPADSGFKKGKTWPEGGTWANADCVQRGSLVTLPYVGDPLTPFTMATKDAQRLDPAAVALPRIPVQPIGYGAAQEIFARMKGTAAPAEWRGGLASDYPLADDALRLRLEVEQRREVARTANVIARLRGAALPDEQVLVGSHHDAWCFGAADPLAGTICTLESARNFCELARAGVRADRTLVFCTWGAEEYGIFGSSEFVEQDAAGLAARAVAYVNLDMAAMGLKPGGAVSPTLRAAALRALAAAPGPRGEGTALDAWGREKEGARAGSPAFGDLGGGSDHVAFWCHAGVPSVSLSAGGSEGTSYHSNYDTVAWYRATVGDDYAAAQLVTGITSAMLAEFARADVAPISPKELAADCIVQAERLAKFAAERKLPTDAITALVTLARACEAPAAAAEERLSRAPRAGDAAQLAALRTAWMRAEGLPGRPWFRNLYAATDRFSGYATAPWPLLREAVEDADPASATAGTAIALAALPYRNILQDLGLRLGELASDHAADAKPAATPTSR